MKATGFIWNGNYVSRSNSFYVKGKVSFRVTYQMLEKFIQKINTKKYKINHKGHEWLSNKQRQVAIVTIEMPIIFLEDLLEKLNIPNVCEDGVYDFYRSELENNKHRANFEPKYYIFNSKKKIGYFAQNTPFVVNGTSSRGENELKHFFCKRI